MNRYNQGFGKFGPMEQTWNGKWVKHEDVVVLEQLLKEYQQKNSKLECSKDKVDLSYSTLLNKCQNIFALLCISVLINMFLSFIVVEFIR